MSIAHLTSTPRKLEAALRNAQRESGLIICRRRFVARIEPGVAYYDVDGNDLCVDFRFELTGRSEDIDWADAMLGLIRGTPFARPDRTTLVLPNLTVPITEVWIAGFELPSDEFALAHEIFARVSPALKEHPTIKTLKQFEEEPEPLCPR